MIVRTQSAISFLLCGILLTVCMTTQGLAVDPTMPEEGAPDSEKTGGYPVIPDSVEQPGNYAPNAQAVDAPEISLDEPLEGLEPGTLEEKAEWAWLNGESAMALRYLDTLHKQAPDNIAFYWRKMRSLYDAAEVMPKEDEDGKLAQYEKMVAIGKECLEKAPDNDGCLVYYGIGLGRIGTMKGIFNTLGNVEEVHNSWKKALEVTPTYASARGDGHQESAYSALGQLNRLLPDSWLVETIAGVRGNKSKAVELYRKARALQPGRLEYNMGLGVALLCEAEEEDKPASMKEGKRILQEVVDGKYDNEWGVGRPKDTIDKEHAQMLLDNPSMACGYSRDKQQEEQ